MSFFEKIFNKNSAPASEQESNLENGKREEIVKKLNNSKLKDFIASKVKSETALKILLGTAVAGGGVYGTMESIDEFKNNPQNIKYNTERVQEQKDREAVENSYQETLDNVREEMKRIDQEQANKNNLEEVK